MKPLRIFISSVQKEFADLRVGTRELGPEAPVTYEIPREVVTEAIVNAVAHRDYTSAGSVQVMLFADRLEIWNPGLLPFSLTLAKLRQGLIPAMARRSRARKPRAQTAKEMDCTWEVDGEVLRASGGWVEWGGELILSMGETSGGAPYGLSLQEYQAILVREAEREKRMEARSKRTWEHLTVDLGGVMEALDSHAPNLVWALDLTSGEAVCFTEEESWEDIDRYFCIHPIEAHESLEIRTSFVKDLPPGKPRTALAQALRQRHPFRAFRGTLQTHPQVRDAWLGYFDDRIRSLARTWVEENLKGASLRTP